MTKVSQMAVSIKMWISLKVPRIEDGNNFGVSVQEEYISALEGMEGSVTTIIASVSSYLSDRGTLLENVRLFLLLFVFISRLFDFLTLRTFRHLLLVLMNGTFTNFIFI